MTYGPDAQPAIGWRSSERRRMIMKMRGLVSTYTREIELAEAKLAENPHDADYVAFLPQAREIVRLTQKQIRRLEGKE